MFRRFIKPVYAHCDVPCGIYETDTLRHAAETCMRMVEKIEELGEIDTIEKQNTFVRCVLTKEEHAQRVKDQIFILWGDYFKPVHIEKFNDLHTTLWQAVKQASEVKHHVSKQECEKLLDFIANIETIFIASKQ